MSHLPTPIWNPNGRCHFWEGESMEVPLYRRGWGKTWIWERDMDWAVSAKALGNPGHKAREKGGPDIFLGPIPQACLPGVSLQPCLPGVSWQPWPQCRPHLLTACCSHLFLQTPSCSYYSPPRHPFQVGLVLFWTSLHTYL